MQAHAHAGAFQRQQFTARATAEEGRARFSTLYPAWSCCGFVLRTLQFSSLLALRQHDLLRTDSRQAQRRLGQQGGVINRRIFGERLVLVDAETEFAQVTALVLERHGIDDRVIRRCQAVGGDNDLRRRLALAQFTEQVLGRAGHHQIRRLQQYFRLRAGDQRTQLRRSWRCIVGAFTAMLLRQVGHVFHLAHRHGRLHQALLHRVSIFHFRQ